MIPPRLGAHFRAGSKGGIVDPYHPVMQKALMILLQKHFGAKNVAREDGWVVPYRPRQEAETANRVENRLSRQTSDMRSHGSNSRIRLLRARAAWTRSRAVYRRSGFHGRRSSCVPEAAEPSIWNAHQVLPVLAGQRPAKSILAAVWVQTRRARWKKRH
jgi:hypothetical protein